MKSSKQKLLWEVQVGDNMKPSYLFGTAHLRRVIFTTWLAELTKYLGDCQSFYSEIELNTDLEHTEFSRFIMLPSEQSLIELLGAKKFIKSRHILHKAFNINLENYRLIQPLIIIQLITEKILSEEVGNALDQMLYKQALQHGLDCGGLETVEEQLSFFQQIELSEQLTAFKTMTRNVRKFRRAQIKLIQCYEQQKIDELYHVTKRSLGSSRKTLLYQRNKNMAQRITEIIPHQRAFIAVGAAHMAGDKGILALLKREGVRLKALSIS